MLLASLGVLCQDSNATVTLISTGPRTLEAISQQFNCRVFNAGDYFCSGRAFACEMRLRSELAKHSVAILIGADVLDETYGLVRSRTSLNAIRFAASIGLMSRIISFSVSDAPSATFSRELRRLSGLGVRLLVRDPVSFRRLQPLGLQTLELNADIAFLLPPAEPQSLPPKLREFMQSSTTDFIGFAISDGVLPDVDRRASMLKLLAEAIDRVNQRMGVKCILLPHHPNDVLLQTQLWQFLSEDGRRRTFLWDALPSSAQIKAVAKCCVHVISSRLHVAIASLGVGTPITCIPRKGKFEGLFEHFRLQDGLFPMGSLPLKADELAEVFVNRIWQSPQLRRQIAGELDRVKGLALRSLTEVGDASMKSAAW